MVRYRTEDGRGWYHEPPYTEAEEDELYRQMDGCVGVMIGPRPTAPVSEPSPLPRKLLPQPPEE